MELQDIHVDVQWLLGAVGTLVVLLATLLIKWIKSGFDRNEKEHIDLRKTFQSGIHRIEGRLNHLIMYHQGVPPYHDTEGDEEDWERERETRTRNADDTQ